jgi:hypothetical protein
MTKLLPKRTFPHNRLVGGAWHILNMTSLNNGEPRSSEVIPPKKVADLGLLAVEYHPTRNEIDADEVNLSNPILFFWWCGWCGHEWQASPLERTEGREACHNCWKLDEKKGLTPLF